MTGRTQVHYAVPSRLKTLARAHGKTILRLKVVLEDGGWTLAPGVSQGSFPVPTADRLRTALTLEESKVRNEVVARFAKQQFK
jgi:hypothetical protein